MATAPIHPYVCGSIDIGTCGVRVCLGVPFSDKWQILGWSACPNSYMKKSFYEDDDKIFKLIQSCWEQALLQAQCDYVDYLAINIPAHYVSDALSHQYLSQNRIFSNSHDLMNHDKALEKFFYKLQNKLESVQAYLYCDILAISQIVTDLQEQKQKTLVIDLGAGTTKWLYFSPQGVEQIGSLPIGGDQMTTDLALGLSISASTAEILKIRYVSLATCPNTLDFSQKEFSLPITQNLIVNSETLSYMNHIVTLRLEEIFSLILERLNKNHVTHIDNVILSGGASRIYGLSALAQEIFSSPVRTAKPFLVTDPVPNFFGQPNSITVMSLLNMLRNEADKKREKQNLFKRFFNKIQNFVSK